MNKREGIRRVVLAGKLTALMGLTVGFLTFFGLGVLGIMLGAFIMILGGLMWVCGWIFDGFTQPEN